MDVNALYFASRELIIHGPHLLRLIEVVGECDAAIAIASFRGSHRNWCRPQFTSSTGRCELTQLRHPLVDDAVPNSVAMSPPNGVLIRFHNVVRPTLPGFSVAPITAMFRGVKKTSSGCTPCSRTEDGLPDAGLLAPGLLVAKGIFGLFAPEIP